MGHLSEKGVVFRSQSIDCKKGSDLSPVGGNSAQYLCCKVFHDWSIINIRERKSYLIYWNMFATLFKFTGVAYKKDLVF